jgi:hypothetical protein
MKSKQALKKPPAQNVFNVRFFRYGSSAESIELSAVEYRNTEPRSKRSISSWDSWAGDDLSGTSKYWLDDSNHQVLQTSFPDNITERQQPSHHLG